MKWLLWAFWLSDFRVCNKELEWNGEKMEFTNISDAKL